MPGPPLELYDGLEGLEEESEEEEQGPEAEPEAAALVVVPRGGLGDSLHELRRLAAKYGEDYEDPELEEEALASLHAGIRRDAAKCPDVATVAWIVRTLEELALDEDESFSELGKILVKRADELQPQSVLDAVCSYGNVYWAGDTELLGGLAGATRRQLKDFTQAEVVRLANGLMRMGGTDDTTHAGLFFEMRERVNLPDIDKFIKDALNRDAHVYQRKSEETQRAIAALGKMPNSELRKKAEKHLQWEIETKMPRLLERARAYERYDDGWDSMADDSMKLLKGEKPGSDGKEDADKPAVRFQDLAASAPP